jgi:hypothetical protein
MSEPVERCEHGTFLKFRVCNRCVPSADPALPRETTQEWVELFCDNYGFSGPADVEQELKALREQVASLTADPIGDLLGEMAALRQQRDELAKSLDALHEDMVAVRASWVADAEKAEEQVASLTERLEQWKLDRNAWHASYEAEYKAKCAALAEVASLTADVSSLDKIQRENAEAMAMWAGRALKAEDQLASLTQQKVELSLRLGKILGPEYDGVPLEQIAQRVSSLTRELKEVRGDLRITQLQRDATLCSACPRTEEFANRTRERDEARNSLRSWSDWARFEWACCPTTGSVQRQQIDAMAESDIADTLKAKQAQLSALVVQYRDPMFVGPAGGDYSNGMEAAYNNAADAIEAILGGV